MAELTEQQAQELIFANTQGDPVEFNESEIIQRFSRLPTAEITPESVCGPDDRLKVTATTAMPYKAICKLYMKGPSGGSYIGTGFLTHRNKLLTAGHCVYERDRFGRPVGWMTSIMVVPGLSGLAEPYGRYQAISLTATRGWIEEGNNRYDMGAIKLSSDVSHSDVFKPSLGDPNRGEVCGYPGDRDTGIFQYRMEHSLEKVGGQFKYNIDTFGGQSGSPLLQNSVIAVGIHNYGGCPNSASDLYQNFIDETDSW